MSVRVARLILLLGILSSGCHGLGSRPHTPIKVRKQVAEQLAIGPPAACTQEETTVAGYRVAMPDILEVTVESRPEVSGEYTITPEGTILSKNLAPLRVEGLSTRAIATCIAEQLGLSPSEVRCRVIAHRSRYIYVNGPVNGPERAVPYQGPENIVSFLRRVGGVDPGADLREIYVVRSNVSRGRPPEVLPVHLEAILLRQDASTNVILQPFDVVYLGELPRSKLGKALPKWLRPGYRCFCTVFPNLCPKDWRQQIRDSIPME